MRNVLKNKLFLATFGADLISNFGDSLYYLALMNYIVGLPDSRFAVSVLGISETLPMLLYPFLWASRRTGQKTNYEAFYSRLSCGQVSIQLLVS